MPASAQLESFLRQQYLCNTLTPSEIRTLLDYTEERHFQKGDIVADVGEVGDALYFVIDGETALYTSTNDPTVVGTIGQGNLMGEMSFFDRKPRMLQIRSTQDHTHLLRLSRDMYKRLRIEHPYIAVNFLEQALISLDILVRNITEKGVNLTRYIFSSGGKR